jgi:ubiquinone/menaquinone biosynthesis C-methylase UbiE
MSWWMSALYDRFMRPTEEACLVDWRAELLAGLAGEVVEIGAGTGANLAHYPRTVDRLVLTEPDRHMLARLEQRVRREGRAAEVRQVESGTLPFPDASFDAVVSTLVLCSVADVDATLREVQRVLRPAGKLVFLEHVAAEDRPSRLVWQRRVEPVWKRIAGNCHLTRRTGEAIRAAGFEVERETRESMRKAGVLVRGTIRGIARKPPLPASR